MFPKFSGHVLTTLLVSMLAALSIGGCSMAPVYERPNAVVPAKLGAAGSTAAPGSATPAELNEQERGFLRALAPDRELAPLVERALAHNADYRLAALKVEQARAQYRIERSARLPTVGVQAEQARQGFDNAELQQRYQQDLTAPASASTATSWTSSGS